MLRFENGLKGGNRILRRRSKIRCGRRVVVRRVGLRVLSRLLLLLGCRILRVLVGGSGFRLDLVSMGVHGWKETANR
jgi:hypothetical protein